MTPPPVGVDEFKSEQRIKLSSAGGVTPIAYGRPRSTQPPPSSAPPSRPRRRSQPRATQAAAQWTPSPQEAARARAQIGSEVLQWHARRLSLRSSSFDETSSAATSGRQSPTTPDPGEWDYQIPNFYGDQNPQAAAVTSPPSPEQTQQPHQQTTMTSSAVLFLKTTTSP